MPREVIFNREKVLEKATILFWNKGFNGTSMQDLVDVTGLNRSSIYNSFGNKRSLYEIVLINYHNKSKDLFQIALREASNPLDAIRKIFDMILKNILEDDEGKGCFSLNCKAELSRSDNAIKALLKTYEESTINLFSALIEEGQRDGSINERETSKTYADYLYSGFQGLKMTGIFEKDAQKLRKIIENIMICLS